MSFVIEEPKIVMGTLTLEIPVSEKREYAKLLKSMAEVATENGKDELAAELVTAAKKLDGRGRKPGTTRKTTKKKATKATKAKKTTKSDKTASESTSEEVTAEKPEPKTKISIKGRPAEEDELSDIVTEEVVDTADVVVSAAVEADADADEFDEFA